MSLKGDLSNEEKHNVINYMKLRMKEPNDRATISEITLGETFRFLNIQSTKDLKFKMMFQQKEPIRAKWLSWTSARFSVLSSALITYNYISTSNRIRVAGLAATIGRRALNGTNMLVNNRINGYVTPSMLCQGCV